MNSEQEKKILAEIKVNITYDLNKGLKNLIRKSANDIKLRLSELLKTSDLNEIKEAKIFVDQSADIMSTDFLNQLLETVNKY